MPKLVFVFSGIGSQWPGMGKELMQYPVFRQTLEQCDQAFRPLAGWSILEELRKEPRASRLLDSTIGQPCVCALEIALFELLCSWGLSPAGVLGHSVGELAAAYAAGILYIPTALRLVWEHCQIVRATSQEGSMLHSLAMEAQRERFYRELGELLPRLMTLPVYSSLWGRRAQAEDFDTMHWFEHIRQPVLFAQAAQAMLDDGYDWFVELGPHPTLEDAFNDLFTHTASPIHYTASLRRSGSEKKTLLTSMAQLAQAGFDLRLSEAVLPPARAADDAAALLHTEEPERRRTWLAQLVRKALATADPQIQMPPEGWSRKFSELGFDSIALVEVQLALSAQLGVELPATLFFTYQTPKTLVEAMLPLVRPGSVAPASRPEPEVPFQVVDFCETRSTPSFHELSRFHLRVQKQVNRKLEIDGKPFIDFASCNYLGLDYHPEVMNAIPKMVAEWGVHPSWTRLVASPEPYMVLEERLAEFLKVSSVVVFPSIASLNIAALPVLAGPAGVILCDIAAHHTIQEACQLAQAKGITCVQYKHNDLNDLEWVLKHYTNRSPIIVTVDGVYSMSAEYENLPAFGELMRRYNAYLYVDDAHGLGVVGENPSPECPYGHKGNGIVNYYGLDCAAERFIYVSGLSKAFSSYAAFLSCPDAETREKLMLSSTYVFSGPVPVASLASALAGLEVNEKEGDQLRATLYRLSHRLASGARALGYEVDNAGGFPIVFVVTGGYEQTVKAINLAWKYGLLITPGIFPIVPYQRGGLRFSLTALNTDEEIETTLQALKEIRQRITEKDG
ncbi:MAG: aminotransferase class I/II-fold pyridoxal phosphate-dependent enzyme [Chloroflexi bacterium]|nr:aminotransferase class I/II-fold pyridoxal phosphate-dependent enzyme [Chloroflexota bacterium]